MDFLLNNNGLFIKNDEFCIKNDGFCINTDELCIKNDGFRKATAWVEALC